MKFKVKYRVYFPVIAAIQELEVEADTLEEALDLLAEGSALDGKVGYIYDETGAERCRVYHIACKDIIDGTTMHCGAMTVFADTDAAAWEHFQSFVPMYHNILYSPLGILCHKYASQQDTESMPPEYTHVCPYCGRVRKDCGEWETPLTGWLTDTLIREECGHCASHQE